MAQSITLQTSDNNVQESDVLGRLSFAASSESSGSDAILIGASIYAMAESDFTEISNATSIIFATSTSESAIAKLKINSQGHFLPLLNKTYDIGASGTKFRNVYAENGKFENVNISNLSDPYEILYITDSAGTVGATDLLKIDNVNGELELNGDIVGTGDINLTGSITANSGTFTKLNSNQLILVSGAPPNPTPSSLYNLSGVLYYQNNPVGILPTGGTASQMLQKISDTSYDLQWIDNYATEVHAYVKNTTGSGLFKGQAVYINGAQGDHPTITLAMAAGESSSSKTLGLLKQDLAINEFGYVVTEGTLNQVDTSLAGAAGDPIWLSPTTPGGLVYGTGNKPLAPNHLVFLGYVIVKQQNNGKIFVKVQNGFELGELHNVGVNGTSNGSFLQYNSASGLWIASTSGNFTTLSVNGTGVSVSGHTHVVSDITNFNSSVSGLLPTISNSGDNRILTSTGSTVGINAESNLTFDEYNNLYIGTTGNGYPGGLNIFNSNSNDGIAFISINDYTGAGKLLLGSNDDADENYLSSYSYSLNLYSSHEPIGLWAPNSTHIRLGAGSQIIASCPSGFLLSNTNLIISNQTANTIASFDSNKNVVSLSTGVYPSLTELSYVKGLTSAIQTQIDTKAATATTITAGSGLAGGGSLAANRTIDIGQGDGMTISADSIAVDSTVVRTTGTQTISGSKTFSAATVFSTGVTISSSGTNVPLTITNDGTGNSFVVNDVTGDSSPFVINNDGRIGIGYSTPDYPVHIVVNASGTNNILSYWNNSNNTRSRIAIQDTSTTYALDFGSVGNNFTVNTVGVERFRIDGDGNIDFKLNSGSVSHRFDYNENGGEIILYDDAQASATLIDQCVNSTRVLELINGSDMVIGLGSSNTTGTIKFMRAGFQEAMRITSAGDIGIGTGTSSPSSKLHIAGTVAYGQVRLSPTADSGESSIGFFQDSAATDTNDAWIIGQGGWSNTGDFFIGNENNGAGGNVRLLIEKGGNVGIGTSNPTINTNGTVLHIHNSTASRASMIHFTNNESGSTATDGLIVGKWSDGTNYIYEYDNYDVILGAHNGNKVKIHSVGTSFYQSANGTPSLGSKNFYAATFENLSAGYGLAIGGVNASTGAASIQVQNFTTSNAYDLILQPLGGAVEVGVAGKTPIVASNSACFWGTNVTTLTGAANFHIITTNAQAADLGGCIGLGGSYSTTNSVSFATISGRKTNSTDNNSGGYLQFATRNQGGGTLVEAMRITDSGDIGIGTISVSSGFKVDIRGRLLSYTTASDGLITTQGLQTASGGTGKSAIQLDVNGKGGFAWQNDASSGTRSLKLLENSGYGSGDTEILRVISGGDFLIGGGSAQTDLGNFKLQVTNNAWIDNLFLSTTTNWGRLAINHNGATTFAAGFNNTDTGSVGQTVVNFLRNGTSVGSISATNAATSYNINSDYRLKHNVIDMIGAAQRLSLLRPVTFEWKVGGNGEGFIAHELAEVVPLAVTGEKDAKDSYNMPIMQSVDHSKLVPLLVAALKEAYVEINNIKNRLSLLEGN